MAELVGLIASIGSIAGAAAKVSLALFECGRDIASARTELDSLASEVSDLSSALEYLIDVVRKHESQIIAQTIKTINNLVMRCEKVLEELKITAELVKSRAARFKWLFRKPKILEQKTNLQAFRSNLSLVIQTLILAKSLEHEPKKEQSPDAPNVSSTTQRNINLLRSFVVNNREILRRLQAMRDEDSSNANLSLPADEKQEEDRFRTELAKASGQHSEGSLIKTEDNLTWEKVLLRSYSKLNEEPPVSEVLNSTIPEQIRTIRTIKEQSSSELGNQNTDREEGSKVETDKELSMFLNEWTSAPQSDINLCLQNHQKRERTLFSGIPRWVQDEYTFDGYDPHNPAHWKPKPPAFVEDTKILPHTRFAYELPDADQISLFNLLANEGGAWVWRHDNGYQRDYFVGSKKVLQYFIKPLADSMESMKIQDRTIVGKQWVSEEILQENGLEYRSYGEGGYSIAGKLKTAKVQYLHEAASDRTEDKLRNIATQDRKPKPIHPESRATALALLSHTDTEIGYLSFEKGDILELDGMPSSPDGWWSAFLKGERGLIPSYKVRVIGEDEASEIGVNSTSAEVETERASRLERWKMRFDRARREFVEAWDKAQKEVKEAGKSKNIS